MIESTEKDEKVKLNRCIAAVLCAPLILSMGCVSTHKLIHSGADPEWSGEPKQRVLVVGLEQRKYRVPFEDTFVEELRSRGIDAVGSYRYAPEVTFFDEVSEVDRVLEEAGVDSVLTVRAEGLREANNDVWAAAYTASWFLVDDFQDRRDVRRVVAGAAAVDNIDADTFGIEIEFWDAESYRSIWVGKTDTYDAGRIEQSVAALADVVLGELRSKGML